jgi:hypothetical protein
LVREGLEKRDLFVAERSDLHSPYEDYPNGSALAQQRRRKRGAMALALCVPAAHRVLAILCGKIMDMNRPTIACSPSNHGVSICRNCLPGTARRRNFSVGGYQPKKVVLQAEDHCVVRVAQASGIFGYRVQHRLNLRRRA